MDLTRKALARKSSWSLCGLWFFAQLLDLLEWASLSEGLDNVTLQHIAAGFEVGTLAQICDCPRETWINLAGS